MGDTWIYRQSTHLDFGVARDQRVVTHLAQLRLAHGREAHQLQHLHSQQQGW